MRGFGLVGVLVASGLLGGLSLVVINLVERISSGAKSLQSLQDRVQIEGALTALLADERHCRVSLAGPGASGSPTAPVTFTKANIDGPGEGLAVELWTADATGNARGAKVYGVGQDFGRLTFEAIKLRLTTPGTPANGAATSEEGLLLVSLSKDGGRTLKMEFPLKVTYHTNASGVSTLHSCLWTPPGGGQETNYKVASDGRTLIGAGGTGVVSRAATLFGQGAGVLLSNPSGNNTFIGQGAGAANTNWADTIAVGHQAGLKNVGSSSVFLGHKAGRNLATSSARHNSLIGSGAGELIPGGENLTIIGAEAARQGNFSGVLIVGSKAARSASGGKNVVLLGQEAGRHWTGLGSNLFVGGKAGFRGSGPGNVFFGAYAGENATLTSSTLVGKGAGKSKTSGSGATFVGTAAGGGANNGDESSFFGHSTVMSVTGRSETFFAPNMHQAGGGAKLGFGYRAGRPEAITTGQWNVFGHRAGESLGMTMAINFFGAKAGQSNTTGMMNLFFGAGSGRANTTGNNNTFLGAGSGKANTTGGDNVFLGYNAGDANTTGAKNVLVGADTGGGATPAESTIIGQGAGELFTGSGLVAVGMDTLNSLTSVTGGAGVYLGNRAASGATDTAASVVVGHEAGMNLTTHDNNTLIGYRAGVNYRGDNAVIIGHHAGENSANALAPNIFIGEYAGQNDSSRGNVMIGSSAGRGNSGGTVGENVMVGFEAGRHLVGARSRRNVIMGHRAGYLRKYAEQSVYLGYMAGANSSITVTPYNNPNIFIGAGAGLDASAAAYGNTAVGNGAGSKMTSYRNAFFGAYAGTRMVGGNSNTFIGYEAGNDFTSGNLNICVGNNSCGSTSSGNNNLVIGYSGTHRAYLGEPGSNNVVLGQVGDFDPDKQADTLAIGPVIRGNFRDKWVEIRDDLRVERDMEVAGGLRASGGLAAAGVLSPSDERFKEVVNLLASEDNLTALRSLAGVRYRYKELPWPTRRRLGLIAQDVREVLPEAVFEINGRLHLDQQALIALMIEGIKELNRERLSLERRLARLTRRAVP